MQAKLEKRALFCSRRICRVLVDGPSEKICAGFFFCESEIIKEMVISLKKKKTKHTKQTNQKKTRHETAETSLLNLDKPTSDLHFLKTIITHLHAQWNLF